MYSIYMYYMCHLSDLLLKVIWNQIFVLEVQTKGWLFHWTSGDCLSFGIVTAVHLYAFAVLWLLASYITVVAAF